MARLSDQEKGQLLAAARRKVSPPPPVPVRPADDFLAFASFASSLKPVPKPVRFGGAHWKL
jgi:hypothetical protein